MDISPRFNIAAPLKPCRPGWFRVLTPLEFYNLDWAVLIEKNGAERLYFVVETKGNLFTDDLRERESAKIACGEAHFKALVVEENLARFKKASKLEHILVSI